MSAELAQPKSTVLKPDVNTTNFFFDSENEDSPTLLLPDGETIVLHGPEPEPAPLFTSGSSVIAIEQNTPVNIPHGLDDVPSSIQVTLSGLPEKEGQTITLSFDETNITITVSGGTYEGDVTAFWLAVV